MFQPIFGESYHAYVCGIVPRELKERKYRCDEVMVKQSNILFEISRRKYNVIFVYDKN